MNGIENFKAYEGRRKFQIKRERYNKLLKEDHTEYLSDLISDDSNDPKSLNKLTQY